jgi:transposase-like protein
MRKHSTDEIRAMLGRADELARNGFSQAEICSGLGISVMTLHRWRKQPFHTTSESAPLVPHDQLDDADLRRLYDLELENQQLRNIIADLMLEKMRY